MKKTKLLLLAVLASTASFAQKADTNKKKVTLTIPKSDFFKDIKTYNIIIQGDDTWESSFANKDTKTYEQNVAKNTIEDYSKKDVSNPDIRVMMGYVGPVYKRADNGTYVLSGDFKYLVLGKNNEILYDKGLNAKLYSPTYTNIQPTQNLVNDLNNIAYKYLKDNDILISEKEYTLNYGVFLKAEEFPELVEFNTKTDEFLNKIADKSIDVTYLNELKKIYLGYVGKEYQKIKPKDYNKVIYLNLSLTDLFLLNFNESLEYLETAKQGAGMMSMWPGEASANITSLATVNQNTFTTKVENPTFDSAYYIYINGSVTQKGETLTGKLKTDRFANLEEGSILKADSRQSKVWIYKDNGDVDFVIVDKNTTIKTDKGQDLLFIYYNNAFILVEKTADSCYKKYESNSTEIYCNENGKYILKK